MAPHTIPQSITFEEFWEIQYYSGTLSVTAAVAFGMLVWDYIQTLPEERDLLFEKSRKPEWQSPAAWAFMALRYSSIVSSFCTMLYSSVRIERCQTAVAWSNGASVIAVAASGTLLCCRVGSLWEYQRLPLALVFVPCITMVCAWAGVATQFNAIHGPEVPFGSNCQFDALAGWVPLGYASSALFMCMVFALAVTRITTRCTMIATNTGFTLINRACILYLFIATLGSVLLLTISLTQWPHDLGRLASSPFYILIIAAVGTRIFFNLQLHNRTLIVTAESERFSAMKWPPLGQQTDVQCASLQPPSRTHEPIFEHAITTHSQTLANDARSDTQTITSTLPGSPSCATSFTGTTLTSPSIMSAGSASRSYKQKRVPVPNYKTLSSLKDESLKSTWHGI